MFRLENNRNSSCFCFQAARAATAMLKVNVDVCMATFCMLDSKRKAIRQEEDRSHEPLSSWWLNQPS